MLTNGIGPCRIRLEVARLDNLDVVYAHEHPARFDDRLSVVSVEFRIESLEFPNEGTYGFDLLVDEDVVTSRRLRVLQVE
jgi:hypothetical protein